MQSASRKKHVNAVERSDFSIQTQTACSLNSGLNVNIVVDVIKLLTPMTKKSSKSSQLRSRNLDMFGIFFMLEK